MNFTKRTNDFLEMLNQNVSDIVTLLLFWRIIDVIENCYPKSSHSVLHTENENEILVVYYGIMF
jgi:hypothetical protein